MPVAYSHKSLLDQDIELVKSFLDVVLTDINKFISRNKDYEKRIRSVKYNELVKKADRLTKQLTELRDNKESYLGSF